MEFSSKLIQNAVNEISQLPGIGKRTALRLALHMLRQQKTQTEDLANALTLMRNNIKFCKNCHNISDLETCEICVNPKRDNSIICVVEDIRDVMAIESTSSFKGLYHVLGGKISPMDGIGPDDLNITSLVDKIKSGAVKELIFQHCVHSWFNNRGHENGSLRASAYFYNTEEEVKLFADTFEEAVQAFS